jgi:hypothetical protein
LLYQVFETGDIWMFDDQLLPVGIGGSNAKAEGSRNFKTDGHRLCRLGGVGVVPAGEAIAGCGDGEAKPFEAL